jgi:hypothetical protein
MALFPTTTWARKAELLPPVGKEWEIQFRLLANGKKPTDSTTSLRSTELWMLIGKSIYWVDIQHGGKRDSVSLWRGAKPHRHYNELGLPDPPFETFGKWVARAEAKFGKEFRRDKIWVRSNLKGGRDAVVAWIQNGYSF